jgi:hypothetical protein
MGYAITVIGVVLYSEAKRHSKADNQGAGKGSPVKGVPSALNSMQPAPVPTVSGAGDAMSFITHVGASATRATYKACHQLLRKCC